MNHSISGGVSIHNAVGDGGNVFIAPINFMPFDPTKPADNSLADAGELRSQFAGLKTLHDDLQATVNELPPLDTVTDLINNNSAGPVTGVTPLPATVSNPPTQAQVQAIVTKVNEMLTQLQRP